MGLGVMCVVAAAILLAKDSTAKLFTADPDVLALAARVMAPLALAMIG